MEQQRKRNMLSLLRELGGSISFVSKGDLLDFYLSVRTLPGSPLPQQVKRAVHFSLVPLQRHG